ncbi:MAG TPA: hypothetical protein VHD90_00450 [Phototrophicaceae bacterium]|nr:hypothetical protein [Phototrophicaceae bacterium]
MSSRNRKIDQRFVRIMIGLLLLIVGLSTGDPAATIVLVGIGLFLLARQFNTTRSTSSSPFAERVSRDREADESAAMPGQPAEDQVYKHALESVRQAGLDPTEMHVLPIDIGLITYSGDNPPMIYRTRPILDDIDYLQPFVQLRLPTRARGRIRFEISDSDGQILFVHEEDRDFERGRNLITPAARLPLHDGHALHADWQLRVLADGVLIAEHNFGWKENTDAVIRRHLEQDGELSGEARAIMAENRLSRVSLDDLLAQQEEDNSAEEPRNQAQRR